MEKYCHYDNITVMSGDEFVDDYIQWTKEKKYHQNRSKAIEVYELASDGKFKRQAKIIGLNKLLKIYYARVSDIYKK